MNKTIITYTVLFIGLILAQVLLMNHIMLFNTAVCFIFIYFIVRLPMDLSSNWLLTLGFLMGLSVDILSDTPGVNALACTVLASLKRPVFYAYEQHDDVNRSLEPGMASMGWFNYSKYLLSMSAIYSLLAFSIEFMSFASVDRILIMAAASALFTFLVLLALDSLIY